MLSRNQIQFNTFGTRGGDYVQSEHVQGVLSVRGNRVVLRDNRPQAEVEADIELAKETIRTDIMRNVYGDVLAELTVLLMSAPLVFGGGNPASTSAWLHRRDRVLGTIGEVVK
jgi:hypothetical protein